MDYFRSASTTTITANKNDTIIFYTVTGNLSEIKKKINTTNANSVIDMKNGYTILHYAVGLENTDIIKYILDCGGDTKIKTKQGKDSYELANEKNRVFIHSYYITKKEDENYKLRSANDELKYKVKTLEDKIEYGNKSSDGFNLKINKLTEENTTLKRKVDECAKRINKLEKDLDESTTAFTNLLKKQRKN